jgi:hypothetical protein
VRVARNVQRLSSLPAMHSMAWANASRCPDKRPLGATFCWV